MPEIVDFECENIVSVWIGRFQSIDDLLEFVDFDYDQDGNSSNLFCEESGINWFDHDSQEANFIGQKDLSDALRGHSWIETFENELMKVLSKISRDSFNSIFLLYDFCYNPEFADPKENSQLKFIGSFDFQKD